MDIKDKLLKAFSGFIKDVNVDDPDHYPNIYRITLENGEEFIFKSDDLKEEINSSTTDVCITYKSGSEVYTRVKKSISNANPNFSFLIFVEDKYLKNLSSVYGCVVEFNGTKFFIDKDSGIVDENKNNIKDKKTLSNLKNLIEENFIKTDLLLSGKDMVVNLGIAETYEILLNQINELSNSESIGKRYFNVDSAKIPAIKDFKDYLIKLKGKNKKFKVDKLNIGMEIPYNYTNSFVSLQDVLKMAEFKKHNGIKEQLEKFIEEKQIDKDDNICDVINKLKRRTDITDDECETFSRNVDKIFHFLVKHDGENNRIQHEANIVFSDDGKKYLIDSSLATYEYLFVKDLALNEEENREYNVELFDTQKNCSWL